MNHLTIMCTLTCVSEALVEVTCHPPHEHHTWGQKRDVSCACRSLCCPSSLRSLLQGGELDPMVQMSRGCQRDLPDGDLGKTRIEEAVALCHYSQMWLRPVLLPLVAKAASTSRARLAIAQISNSWLQHTL